MNVRENECLFTKWITPGTALQLERVLGVSAAFWNNLGEGYHETLARLAEQEHLQE